MKQFKVISIIFLVSLFLTVSINSALASTSYYTNSNGQKVSSPVKSMIAPKGASAKCKDGTYSFSKHRRGTCSGHRGVSKWL